MKHPLNSSAPKSKFGTILESNHSIHGSFGYACLMVCFSYLNTLTDKNSISEEEKKFERVRIYKNKRMACSVPFNKKDLDISFFVFKPTVVIVDDLVHGLKQFSLRTESLGCVQSSIFRSIHGNMIIWYGAWQKRSSKKEKELLTSTLKSMLTDVSSMAVLMEHSFLEAYAGESRDGSSAAKFSTGDIMCINSADTTCRDLNDLSYAVLAIFRSRFAKMEGITAGLCLKGQSRPIVVCIHVWKCLHFCYSWILNSDHRKWMMPYLERFSIDMKYDIFRVVYVSGDNVVDLNYISPHQMLENGEESRHEQVMQQN